MTCRSCDKPAVGKSAYCSTHRAEAREAWRAKISAESEARDARKAEHADLWARAVSAGIEAWHSAIPTPMLVGTAKGLFDDSFDESKPVYHVSEGVCGFASLVVRPANSSFAHWLKANVRTNKHYGGGLAVSSSSIVPEDIRSQSYERKVAAIRAVANVLREAGIKASCWDRLD